MSDISLDLALGSTTLFFEEGIGIFVEPIKVNAINFNPRSKDIKF